MLSLFYRIIRLDDAPRSIALGGSIGLVISMTPTYGFQMMLALFTNTIFRCNRLAGIVAVHFSNPVTALPLYWLDYRLGVHLLGQTPIHREEFTRVLSGISSAPFIDALHQLVTLGWGIFGPIALGGIILGAILGAGSYVPLLYGIKRFKEARALRRARRKLKRREDRRERTEGPAGGAPLERAVQRVSLRLHARLLCTGIQSVTVHGARPVYQRDGPEPVRSSRGRGATARGA